MGEDPSIGSDPAERLECSLRTRTASHQVRCWFNARLEVPAGSNRPPDQGDLARCPSTDPATHHRCLRCDTVRVRRAARGRYGLDGRPSARTADGLAHRRTAVARGATANCWLRWLIRTMSVTTNSDSGCPAGSIPSTSTLPKQTRRCPIHGRSRAGSRSLLE